MKIKILSDSTCDLSKALLEQYDITLVPLTVVKGDDQFKDGITITPSDIFAHVAAGGALCSTAAASIGEYADLFEQYLRDHDAIVLISLGSGFSACHQNAILAAEEFENVLVIDSASLCCGQGLVVLKARELAEAVCSLEELKQKLDEFKQSLDCSFVVDKLDYLAKGGRCSSATALGANLLSLKPCIELKDNRMAVGKKYRGSFQKSILNYIRDRLDGRGDIDTRRLMLVYTEGTSEELLSAVRSAIAECAQFDEILESTAGCTISCHCGPGTLGIMFSRK